MEATAAQVRTLACRFLLRWSDPATVNLAEDLAQLTTLDTLAHLGQLLDERRLPGFVRTIARRQRYRTLFRERRHRAEAQGLNVVEAPAHRPDVVMLRVSTRWVERDLLLRWLDDALARLTPLNSQLLREFYAGRSCRELAHRHRLRPETVKVRLYRSRARVRACLERRVVLSV
jgi:RNA polymerase sigma factor (sigma-70 family)